MDERAGSNEPPLGAGNRRARITCAVLPAPYFSQRNVESGYTRCSRDPLGWPSSPPPPPPPARQLKTLFVGKKEDSGFVCNVSKLRTLGQAYDDPQRFLTFYNSEFSNGGLLSQMRAEFPGCGMSSCPVPYRLQESGFTRGGGNPLVCPPGTSSDPRPGVPKAGLAPKALNLGQKERSGFVNNMPNFQRLGDMQDAQRFLTHYQSTFCNVSTFPLNG